jgi:hypothetical protein
VSSSGAIANQPQKCSPISARAARAAHGGLLRERCSDDDDPQRRGDPTRSDHDGWRRSQTRLVSGVGARFTAARCSLAPVMLLYSSPPNGYSRGYG